LRRPGPELIAQFRIEVGGRNRGKRSRPASRRPPPSQPTAITIRNELIAVDEDAGSAKNANGIHAEWAYDERWFSAYLRRGRRLGRH
jgi:hypothetical protein